jgi:hypothetical protein
MILIDQLLPETWPANVSETLVHWHQGELLASPPFFYAANPQHPLLPFTEKNGDSARDWQVLALPVGERPSYGVITSQTCDICEAKPTSPFIEVAPVYDLKAILKDGQENDIRNHHWNNYIYLTQQPEQDHCYVADLRIILPVEKGALVGKTPVEAFATEADRLIFAERLATRVRRPAYADAVQDLVIRPLDDWIRSDHRKALKESSGRFTDVEEVRLRFDGDRLDPAWVQLVVFQETPLSREDQGPWRQWREVTNRQLSRQVGIPLRPVQFTSLAKMSAADYRLLAPVWLRYLGRGPRS